MRYLVQLLIPALLLIGVIYAVVHSRKRGPSKTGAGADALLSTPGFVLVLVVGAAFTVALLFGVGAWAAPLSHS